MPILKTSEFEEQGQSRSLALMMTSLPEQQEVEQSRVGGTLHIDVKRSGKETKPYSAVEGD